MVVVRSDLFGSEVDWGFEGLKAFFSLVELEARLVFVVFLIPQIQELLD